MNLKLIQSKIRVIIIEVDLKENISHSTNIVSAERKYKRPNRILIKLATNNKTPR